MCPPRPEPRARATLQLRARNELAEIGRIAERVESFGAEHGFPKPVLHDVQVCIDEVLVNIFNHAYDDSASHEIEIRLEVDERRVLIEIVDDGRPFDPLASPPPELVAAAARRNLGGLGIYFIRRLVDHIAYERVGDTNRLVMSKNLRGAAPAD